MPDQETIVTTPDEIQFATDSLDAPVYFVDYIRGALIANGVVKLNLVDNRLDAIEQGVKTVHVATIITPLVQLRAWAHYLTGIADQNNLPPFPPPEAEVQEEPVANG